MEISETRTGHRTGKDKCQEARKSSQRFSWAWFLRPFLRTASRDIRVGICVKGNMQREPGQYPHQINTCLSHGLPTCYNLKQKSSFPSFLGLMLFLHSHPISLSSTTLPIQKERGALSSVMYGMKSNLQTFREVILWSVSPLEVCVVPQRAWIQG